MFWKSDGFQAVLGVLVLGLLIGLTERACQELESTQEACIKAGLKTCPITTGRQECLDELRERCLPPLQDR